MADPKPGRSSFGPVVLVGVASAALTTVAASQSWFEARMDGMARSIAISGSDGAPLALALALVALAGWGVILVSGTRARRVAAVVGLLAVLGTLAVVVTSWSGAEDTARNVLESKTIANVLSVSHRPWYWVTAVAAVVQLAALVAAVRLAPSWPTMSSRYDAPGAGAGTDRPDPAVEGERRPDLELWKALDEGHDPTAGTNP